MEELYNDTYNDILEEHMKSVAALEDSKRELQGYIEQGYVLQYGKEFVPLPVFEERILVEGLRQLQITRLSSSLYYVSGVQGTITKAYEINGETGTVTRVTPRMVDFNNIWNGVALIDENEEEEVEGTLRVKMGRYRTMGYYMNSQGSMVEASQYILNNDRRFHIEGAITFGKHGFGVLEEEGVPATKALLSVPKEGRRHHEVFLYRGEWYAVDHNTFHLASGKMTGPPLGDGTHFSRVFENGNIPKARVPDGVVSYLIPTEVMEDEYVELIGPRAEGVIARVEY